MSIHCYTPRTVSKHKKTCDAWISIHGNVYDITNFITVHPGGEDVLIEAAGTDATKCFDSIGHSNEAQKLMNDYKIGILSLNDECESTSIDVKQYRPHYYTVWTPCSCLSVDIDRCRSKSTDVMWTHLYDLLESSVISSSL